MPLFRNKEFMDELEKYFQSKPDFKNHNFKRKKIKVSPSDIREILDLSLFPASIRYDHFYTGTDEEYNFLYTIQLSELLWGIKNVMQFVIWSGDKNPKLSVFGSKKYEWATSSVSGLNYNATSKQYVAVDKDYIPLTLKGIPLPISYAGAIPYFEEIYKTFLKVYNDFHVELENLFGVKVPPLTPLGNSEPKIEKPNKMKATIQEQPKNQILYGPPGTGKTYNAIPLAVSIIEPDFFAKYAGKDTFDTDEWKEIKTKFDELKESQLIEFVTFHQSMSYEDFVEGLKPEVSKSDKEKVNYIYEEGIFKRAAKKAIQEMLLALRPEVKSEYINSFDDYYGSYIEHLRNNHSNNNPYKFEMVSGGKIILVDFTNSNSIKIKYEHGETQNSEGKLEVNLQKNYLKQLFNSKKPAKEFIGNIKKKMTEVVGYCGNPSPYWAVYNDFCNFINLTEPNFINLGIGADQDDATVVGGEVSYNQYLELIKDIDFNDDTIKQSLKNSQPVVLIIDEINRGNIANIFGELITLIESSKRIGEPEMITVKLPYSKTDFSVPTNLYIIGTMNTADRSVEALDTALRRRFTFIEKAPQPKLLKDKKIDEIELETLLKTINRRITVLLDKDHCIGHSYFMHISSIEDLLETFRDKLIPLLQEYFYNDIGKIRLILGDFFVKKEDSKVNFAVSYELESEIEAYYQINPIDTNGFVEAVKNIYK